MAAYNYSSDPAHHAPEVLPPTEEWKAANAPEAYWNPGMIVNDAKPTCLETPEVYYVAASPSTAASPTGNSAAAAGTEKGSAAQRRRVWLFLGAGLALLTLIIITGVVLGVVFGLGLHKQGGGGSNSSNTNSSSGSGGSNSTGPDASGDLNQNSTTGPRPEDSSSPSATTSACRGKVCPQILTAVLSATRGAGSSSSMSVRLAPGTLLHVFARGNDSNIWRRSHDGTNWIEPSWMGLGAGGSSSSSSSNTHPVFASEPRAVAWKATDGGSRVSVLAVAQGGGVHATTLSGTSWMTRWESLNGGVASPASACAVVETDGSERAHVFALSDSAPGIIHDMTTPQGWMVPHNRPNWDDLIESDGNAATSAVEVLCRVDHDAPHDLLYLDGTTLMHRVYNASYTETSGSYMPPVVVARGFVSHPVVVPVSTAAFHVFGLGTDGAVWFASWTKSSGWGQARSLGGDFQSVPSAVSNDGGGLDIIALGKDDTIKHRHRRDDGQWDDAWEDLGVFAHSAPLAVYLGGTKKQVALMAVGRGGALNFNTFSAPADGKWVDKGEWKSVDGVLSTDFMKIGR